MEAKTELKYIFSNVNEWLKFAEAKHAGLIVLNSGLVIGIVSCYTTINNLIDREVILTTLFSFGVSVFASIISQFPVTQNAVVQKKKILHPNIYFFGHLSHMEESQIIEAFKKVTKDYDLTDLDKCLLNQIKVNARITEAKFTFFKVASYLTAFGCGLIGLTAIYKVLCH